MAISYTVQRLLRLYASDVSRTAIIQAEKSGIIPTPERKKSGSIRTRIWSVRDLPKIGAHYGFVRKLSMPSCITVFTTKGGVLKTTLALNVARLAALHNMRTCVVGLDLQGDITTALGFNADIDDAEDMDVALLRINSARGLGDVFKREAELQHVVQPTELPTLSLIPETADLVALDKAISTRARREYWLKEHVVDPLKEHFDLVVLDCSPNWNHLISNALVASDVLLSPVECRINQFRNLQVFRELTDEFRRELRLKYTHIFIPTRFASTRKLSAEIRSWYIANIPNITHSVIRESAQGEESVAAHLSVPEYAPTSLVADEMRELLKELWGRIRSTAPSQARGNEFEVDGKEVLATA